MKARPPIIATILGASLSIVGAAVLQKEFRNPPHPAKPWVYWINMDGHLAREGITADFEAMKRAGIGGMIYMDVDVGVPRGNVPFMSPTWQANFKHAVLECERLGLEFTTITGPGWTGTGGPWVKAEHSMQHLVPVSVNARGPGKFDQVLPKPRPRVSRYHRKQTPQMRQELAGFYEDVAVYAFPRRDPPIEDVHEKALFIRNPYTSMKGVRPYLPSPVGHAEPDTSQVIDPRDIIDLTARLQQDGRLEWDVPPGEWTILRMGRRSTGANTRPAPAAGLGFESNKFDKKALEAHFEAYFDPLLNAIGPRPKDRKTGFTGLDADSWEMSSQNWTPGFRDEFKKRRGYDPWPYFPAYSGRVVRGREITERFLWDVRMTCQELLLDNHMAHMKELCHERGLKLTIEPYDMNPCNDMDLGSYADIPMGEFWLNTFNSAWSCIEAASIGHVMGKPVVAAEAFTSVGTWWQQTPWTLKDQTDWAFAAGINRFVIVTFAHQPWQDRAPGMMFAGYGLHWERTQTFWPLLDGYHQYLARCSHLLQQGVTVADILYLTPEGAPHVFRAPASALEGADGRLPDKKGYGFDACSPRMLIKRAEVRDGRISFPGGSSYRLMVLPNFETMTPQLLTRIRNLVKDGATVLGAPPIKSPSLSDYPACDEKVRGLVKELWGDLAGPGQTATPKLTVGSSRSGYPVRGQGSWDVQIGSATRRVASWKIRRENCNPALSSRLTGRLPIGAEDDPYDVGANAGARGRQFKEAVQPGQAGRPRQTRQTTGHPACQAVAGRRRLERSAAKSRDDRQELQTSPALGGLRFQGNSSGKGRICRSEVSADELYPTYESTVAVLKEMGVDEDFAANGPVRYTHRRTKEREIYFLANRSDEPLQVDCGFRVAKGQPELWDAVTGTIRDLCDYKQEDGRTTVPMRFAPYQSFFVVFPRDGVAERRTAAGSVNFPELAPVATLTGAWEVSFDPERGGPAKTTFPELQDWTAHDQEGIKYYSGIATYRKEFDVQSSVLGKKNTDHRSPITDRFPLYLDLGKVHEMARVRLNGKDLGVVWGEPWRIEITDALKAKGNELEIEVANLWPNRLIGDAARPREKRVTWTIRPHPFKAGSKLLPSGLIGPVRITAEQRLEPR